MRILILRRSRVGRKVGSSSGFQGLLAESLRCQVARRLHPRPSTFDETAGPFSFGDERLGQGRQNATGFLREHPDVCQAILAGIQAEVGPEQVVSARLLPVAVDAAEQNGQVKGDQKARIEKAASRK
jgi:hypothetical protein